MDHKASDLTEANNLLFKRITIHGFLTEPTQFLHNGVTLLDFEYDPEAKVAILDNLPISFANANDYIKWSI